MGVPPAAPAVRGPPLCPGIPHSHRRPRFPPTAAVPGGSLGGHPATTGDACLRFLTDPTIPFTNNRAEQTLRMMRLQMKISGCFRTVEGARRFADLRSLIETDRKQGRDLLAGLLPTALPP